MLEPDVDMAATVDALFELLSARPAGGEHGTDHATGR